VPATAAIRCKPCPHEKIMTAISARTRLYFATAILSVTALVCSAPAMAQHPKSTLRSLTGTVTDTSREPLRGAVVQLQNPDNNSVESYLTDTDGHYNFKRLSGDSDYNVWVVFRGHRTPSRSISKFDSHLAKVIDFTVKPVVTPR
jgi:hypothetical protein